MLDFANRKKTHPKLEQKQDSGYRYWIRVRYKWGFPIIDQLVYISTFKRHTSQLQQQVLSGDCLDILEKRYAERERDREIYRKGKYRNKRI